MGIYIDNYRFIGIYPFLSHAKYRILAKSDDYQYLSAIICDIVNHQKLSHSYLPIICDTLIIRNYHKINCRNSKLSKIIIRLFGDNLRCN